MTVSDQTESLAARTVRGAGWLVGWRFASRLLGIVNTVVLVRLLTPSDFGLVALATSFSSAIDSVSYLGVQEALVREHVLDRSMYDTGFTMNMMRGLLTALLVAACALPAAHFFGDARLADILFLLALALFMGSLENVGTIDFQRDLTFGKQVQIQLVPRIVGIIASITCAVIWHSYWALVAGILATRGMRLIFTYVVHPYRPRVTLRVWRRLVGFSFWSWALSMTGLVQARVDTLVIGGYLNPTMVGLYSVGSEVGGLASSELLEPVSRALFAGFSAARRAGDGIAAAYLRAISVVALMMLPTSAGIALVAQPLMHLVFGPRWDAAIPLVQLFACIGVIRVAASISGTLLMAEGVPHLGFRIELVTTILRVATLLILVPAYGLMGAAASVAITALIEETIYLVFTFRRSGLRARDLAANLWRPTLATAVMAAVLLAAGPTGAQMSQTSMQTGLSLTLTVVAGICVYGATLLLAWIVAGRPRGAETYVLAMANTAIRRRFAR